MSYYAEWGCCPYNPVCVSSTCNCHIVVLRTHTPTKETIKSSSCGIFYDSRSVECVEWPLGSIGIRSAGLDRIIELFSSPVSFLLVVLVEV